MNLAQLSDKIEKITTDLKLIGQFNRPLPQQRIRPTSLREISTLLKKKNQKFEITKESKERGQDQLNRKGINLKSLLEKVKVSKMESYQRNQTKKVEQECYFYLPELNFNNQQEYANKSVEFTFLNLIQDNLASRPLRKRFHKRIIGRDQAQHANLSIPEAVNNFVGKPRSTQKKQIYVSVVKNCIQRNANFKDMVETIRDQVKLKFWEILFQHIQHYDKKINRWLLSSLEFLQAEFDAALPISKESIGYYLTTNYLQKLQNNDKYDKHSDGVFWGLAFLYFRAGRKAAFKEKLSSRATTQNSVLLQAVEYNWKSIQNRRPQRSEYRGHLSDDIFLKQITYAICGESKFSSPALSNIESLDFVWILIRNLGIYNDQQCMSKYSQLKNDLFNFYKKSMMAEKQILGLFYLADYEHILELGSNLLIDRDDLLHILLALVSHPDLCPNEIQISNRKRLTAELGSFIQQLMSENRQEALYYMALIPAEYLAAEISTIVSSTQTIQTLNWNLLKRLILKTTEKEEQGLKNFNQIVLQSLRKSLSIRKNYILIAEKYQQLLGNKQKALEFIFQMLIKSVLKVEFSESDLDRAQQLASKWSNQFNKGTYHAIKIMLENRQLVKCLRTRNSDKIHRILGNSPYIVGVQEVNGEKMQQLRINFTLKKAIERLIQEGGEEVYSIYLSNVLKAAEIYCVERNLVERIEVYRKLVYHSTVEMSKDPALEACYNCENAKILRQQLRQSLDHI